jgi:predicted nucleic acid-binding protein
MGLAKVLDTGVLLGVTIEKDTHHELCFEYVNDGGTCYVTPTVKQEFGQKENEIRTRLYEEINDHRVEFASEVDSDTLSIGAIDWVRSNLLDRDMDSFRFLAEYYQQKREECRIRNVDKLEVVMELEDMEMEVWEDAAKDKGGLESLYTHWQDGIGDYSDVERDLLIYEGDDDKVCLEAHHIAVCLDHTTEIGTTNRNHFIKQCGDEEETREDNILRVTELEAVRDLAWDGRV